jgi:signal transduction histidine kinase
MDLMTHLSRRTALAADLVLGLALSGMLAIELALMPGDRWSTLIVSPVVVMLVLLRERSQVWPLAAALAISAVAAGVAVRADLPSQPGVTATTALLVLGASAVRLGDSRPAWLLALAGLAVLTVSRAGLRGSLILPAALLGVIGWGLALGLGLWLRSVDAHRQTLLAAARRDERLELARELHDDVAHHIAAIVVQSQAAGLLASRHAERRPAERLSAEHLPGALAGIEASGNDALLAMRRVIGLLRDGDDPQGTPQEPADIEVLVRRFEARGPSVELQLPADLQAPPEIWTTIYRITQEALTNIVRHAPAARVVRVVVQVGQSGLTLEVTDDGPRHPSWTGTSRGFGLIGMRERVEALGGDFEAGPGPDRGWIVRAVLPHRAVVV